MKHNIKKFTKGVLVDEDNKKFFILLDNLIYLEKLTIEEILEKMKTISYFNNKKLDKHRLFDVIRLYYSLDEIKQQ